MGLNTSVQQFLERLREVSCHLLFFLKQIKQLDKDEIIEILDQAKAPECHEAVVNSKLNFVNIS
jgi:hypothetical protein